MVLEIWILLLGFLLYIFYIRSSTKTLPPGPWGLPIFGHLFFLGGEPHKTLLKWKEKFGPIIFCRFGSFLTVVLQDAKIIKQAFSMAEMAGRAELKPFAEGTEKKGIIFSEGAHAAEQRQFAIKHLKERGVGNKSIESKIEDGLLEFLETIDQNEGSPLSSIRITNKYVLNTLWTILMTEHLSDENVNHLSQIVQEKANQVGGVLSQLALFMPWMETLALILTLGYGSLTNFKKEAFQEVYRFMGRLIAERKDTGNRVKGQPMDLLDVYLDKVEETTDVHSSFHPKHNVSQHFVGDLFLGSVETTSTTLEWLFYYLARNPQVQNKLQEEIGRVVGTSRLPSLSDKPEMPFAEGVIYETLRMSSIFPLGLHHQTLTDVTFQNYKIPKNTMIIANVYGVHHDEKVWGDPDNFRPERWLEKDGGKLKSGHFLPFTYGKRSCIGETLAKDQLFMYTASIFQRYSVRFADGQTPVVKAVQGVIISPAHFQMVFKSRKSQIHRN